MGKGAFVPQYDVFSQLRVRWKPNGGEFYTKKHFEEVIVNLPGEKESRANKTKQTDRSKRGES
jgi:hypothetical protein